MTATPASLATRRDRRADRLMRISGGGLAVGAAFLLGWTIAPSPRETAPRLSSAPPPVERAVERPLLPVVVVPEPPRVEKRVEPVFLPPQLARAEPTTRAAARAVPVATGPREPAEDAVPERVVERDPSAAVRPRDPVQVAIAEPRNVLPAVIANVVGPEISAPTVASEPRKPRSLPRCKGFQAYRPTSPCTNAPPS